MAQNTHNILQWLGNLLWLGNRVCITCYDVVVSGDCGTHRFNHNRHVKIIIIATATFIAPVKRPSITALTKEHCASNQDHCFRLCLERPSSGPEAIRPRRNDDHHSHFCSCRQTECFWETASCRQTCGNSFLGFPVSVTFWSVAFICCGGAAMMASVVSKNGRSTFVS